MVPTEGNPAWGRITLAWLRPGLLFSKLLREIEEPLARAVAIVRRNEAWKHALGERLAAMEAALVRLTPAGGAH